MNINPELAGRYAEFLEENSQNILRLCNALDGQLCVAVQCMDQKNGLNAAKRLAQIIDTIKSAVPVSDDACHRLILALKRIAAIGFGR